jgi:hypothetical protein
VRLFRRRESPKPIGEAEAYARLHGDRGEEILRVEPMPPAPPEEPRREVTGESLRRAFERRLAKRDRREAT